MIPKRSHNECAVLAAPLRSALLVPTLEEWLHAERAKLSRHNGVAKAIEYLLTVGRPSPASSKIGASRGLTLGGKSRLFGGSERGAERAAVMYTLSTPRKCRMVWEAPVARAELRGAERTSSECSFVRKRPSFRDNAAPL